MWWATITAGRGQFSDCVSVTRASEVGSGSRGMSRGTGCFAFGTRPKYSLMWARAWAASKSPTSTRVAFSGT